MNIPAPVFAVARILLALMFVLAGLRKLGSLEGTAGYIASQGLPLAGLLAPAVALFEIVAGLALAIGYQTRIAALLLALFTLVASVIFHAFWAVPAEQAFMQHLLFMKNLSVVGGLLMVFGLGAGGASVDARRAAA